MKFPRAVDLIRQVAASSPQLARGRVWCYVCGHTETVDSAHCLIAGWPEHCGQTMSVDSPEERAGLEPARGAP